MNKVPLAIVALAVAVLLPACAQTPMGPMVTVIPKACKSFEAFEADQAVCKNHASREVAGQAEATNNQAVGGALLGTILGAGLGAAIGGGRGAAIGAASGAVVGTGYGANASAYGQMSIQQRYDQAYAQCMYSKGNKVPGWH